MKLIDQLHPVDVIVAKKKSGLSRVLDHYIVYLGKGVFIGNLKGCVKIIPHQELDELLRDYEPVRIRRFSGNNFDVQKAIQRAYQRLGQKYSYLGFNCEHYANWVQYGKEKSNQVNAGLAILGGILFLRMMSNDE
ncbi:lecithin retinol acyltransferase family protein [Allomuricauda sp. XS_ASV26]|uniref:lecithin retinol acyltransferase family protein n=1 Tax=Allomuricauda sp. XS_ASV26 TaxID=3241292 RepID=UPI0035129B7A